MGRTLSVEGEDGLNGNIDAFKAIVLKHDLAHALSVLDGVHGGFGEENLAAPGIDAEALVKGVVPESVHVLPVAYDAVLERLAHLEVSSEGRGLVAAHDVLDLDTSQGRGIAPLLGSQDRSPDNGGKGVIGKVCTDKGSQSGTRGERVSKGLRRTGAGIASLDESSALVEHNRSAVVHLGVRRSTLVDGKREASDGQGGETSRQTAAPYVGQSGHHRGSGKISRCGTYQGYKDVTAVQPETRASLR
jgi:hypothetical protein